MTCGVKLSKYCKMLKNILVITIKCTEHKVKQTVKFV